MNNFKEKVMENKTASIVTAAIIIILIILGILLGNGAIDFSGDNKANVSESGNMSDSNSELEMMKEGDDSGSYDISGSVFFNTVKFPVFADPDLFDYKGGKNSCGDEIAWVTTNVAPTRAVLNATLKTMFDYKDDLGFTPGNSVANQADLNFDRAVIENRVAGIYLTGDFNIVDDCDISRIITQVEEATLQFGTVTAVQIFLNDELLR
jgi:hypothetical protein